MRKVGKILLRAIAGLLVFVAALVVLVFITAQLPPVRQAARDQVLSALRGSLRGKLEVDDMRWPRFDRVELSGIRVHDRSGQLVLAISSITADLRLRPLFWGQLEVTSVDVEHPVVLLEPSSDERGLLSVFGSDTTSQPDAPKQALSPLVVDVEALCLARGRVDLQLAERALALRRLEGCVGMRIGETLEIALQRLAGELSVEDAPVLRITSDPAAGTQLAAAAISGRLRAGGTKDLAFDARIDARGLSAQTLTALQLPAAWLRKPLALALHATQESKVLRARATLGAGDDRLELQARLDPDAQLQAQLTMDQLQVARVTSLALPPLSVDAHVQADLSHADKHVQLRVPYALYGSLPLPRLDVRGTLQQDGGASIPALRASYGAAVLTAEAQLNKDGALHASAKLDAPELSTVPPLERKIPALRGRAQASVELERTASGELDLDGSLQLQDAAFEAERVRALRANWHVSGELEQPSVQLDAEADGLHLAQREIPRAELQVSGGPDEYTLQLRAPHTRALHAFARVRRSREGVFRGQLRCGAKLGPGELSLRASEVRFAPGREVSVAALSAEYLGASVRASGSLDLRTHASQLRAQLQGSLPPITRAWAGTPIDGELSADIAVQGTLERPRVDFSSQLRNGPALAGARSRGELQGRVDLGRRRASLQLSAAVGEARVEALLNSRLASRAELAETFLDAHHKLDLDAAQLSFAALRKLGALPPAEVVHGNLATQLHAQGTLRAMQAESHTQIELRGPNNTRPARVSLDADYQDAQLKLRASASDRDGELLGLRGELHARLERALRGVFTARELVEAHAWNVDLRVAERRLGTLPGARELGVGPTLRSLVLAADGALKHDPGTEPNGRLSVRLAMPPRQGPDRLPCGTAGPGPKLTATAELSDGRLVLQANADSQGQNVLTARSAGTLPLSAMLGAKTIEVPRHVSLSVDRADLSELPYVCERARGQLSADVTLDDLFQGQPQLEARVQADQLSWDGSPSLSGRARAWVERGLLRLQSEIFPGAGRAKLTAHLPVQLLQEDSAFDVRPEAPLEAQLDLQRVDLGSLLAFVPGIARPSGRIDGEVSLSGSLQHPLAYGSVTLDNVSFTLPRAAQRFSNMHAEASLSGRTLRLEELEVHDLGGVARAQASLTLPSLAAWHAEIELQASDFPVRKSGMLVGYVDADASVEARSDANHLDVEARLRNMSVALSGNTGAELQSLEPNPDIVFASQLSARTQDRVEDGVGLSADLHIVTTEPLWVRRSDFAVLMNADVSVELADGEPELRGDVELLRGYLSLLGQSFDIQRGRVTFTGGASVDPQLQLTAVQNKAGKNVRIEVSGFVNKPKLTFFVADKPVTAGQAVLALTGSPTADGNASASAQSQVASAAIGMTTGLLSLAARQEFGDWVPMLQIETGQRTRVRVGFDADRLIPSFLRGFVRGAYVEGLLATSSDVTQAQSGYATSATRALPGGGGVLIELMLPADWVWAGQYGPGNTWSIDLNWRP